MVSIYKPKRAGKPTRRYRIAYRDHTGRRKVRVAFTDRQATQALARKIERDTERLQAGLPIHKHTTKPTAQAIEEYIAELAHAGRSTPHIKETRRLLAATTTTWRSLQEIREKNLVDFLTTLKVKGRLTRTINSYRDALVTFLNWCVRKRYLQESPVSLPKARGPRQQRHRAFTTQEFFRITAPARPRSDLYLVAGLSGLRRNELRQLEAQDVILTSDPPRWQLRPEITKAKRRERLPILNELLPTIRRLHLHARPRLFTKIPRTKTFHHDLKAAGIKRKDQQGRLLVFHSFRYFFCTLLARTLPIQTVKFLMRHHDIRTTCNLYMDLNLTDANEAILRLPPILPEPPHKEAADQDAATGAGKSQEGTNDASP